MNKLISLAVVLGLISLQITSIEMRSFFNNDRYRDYYNNDRFREWKSTNFNPSQLDNNDNNYNGNNWNSRWNNWNPQSSFVNDWFRWFGNSNSYNNQPEDFQWERNNFRNQFNAPEFNHNN